MPSALQQLKKAKAYSDVRDYPRKVAILRSLIQESPEDFFIDSRDKGIVGVTHKPTGFRIHMPYSAYPAKKADEDLVVYTAVPPGSEQLIKKHGLLSAKALIENPEVLAAVIANRRNTSHEMTSEEFADSVRARLRDSPWTRSQEGPSVLFGMPDPDKITEKHPSRQFQSDMYKLNLGKLLKDIPETVVQGTELIPYYENMSESDIRKRRGPLTKEQIRAYIDTPAKELWKHYDEPEGKRYASNVPHGFVITPTGSIPAKYLEKISSAKYKKAYAKGYLSKIAKEQDKYVHPAGSKPDLNNFIKHIEEEARKRGVKDMHVVMSHPDHPLGGGSAHYTTDLDKDSKSALLVKALRGKMREWEQQQGLDPDHDWSEISSAKDQDKYVYHASPKGDIEEFEPRVTRQDSNIARLRDALIYATKDKKLALSMAAGPGLATDDRIAVGYSGEPGNLKFYIDELVPGALQDYDREAYLYTLPGKTFKRDRDILMPEEVVSEVPVRPIGKKHIKNILKALQETEGVNINEYGTYEPLGPKLDKESSEYLDEVRSSEYKKAYVKEYLSKIAKEQALAKKKIIFKHSCCGRKAGDCSGCAEKSTLIRDNNE